jgi:hypothetical protein
MGGSPETIWKQRTAVLVHKDPLKPTIEIQANVATDAPIVLIRNVFKSEPPPRTHVWPRSTMLDVSIISDS